MPTAEPPGSGSLGRRYARRIVTQRTETRRRADALAMLDRVIAPIRERRDAGHALLGRVPEIALQICGMRPIPETGGAEINAADLI